MKIDPVYLVQPRPTRRAFLLAGSAFAGGVVVGGAGGFAIGVRSAAGVGIETPAVLRPSGNAELDDLRRLAVEAPIEELTRRGPEFIAAFNRNFSDDAILARGVRRLAERVVSDDAVPARLTLARFLVRTAKVGAAARDDALIGLLPRLEAILK